MVSLLLRKGFPASAAIEPPRTVHAFDGVVNFRRCATCGRTPVQAQLLPFAPCTPPRPMVETDVAARLEICLLGLAQGVDAALIDQVLRELGEAVRDARAARLPAKGSPVAARLAAVVRNRRRRA